MPRRPSKAILQHSLARTMEFTALRILLWGDDDDDTDVEFLEDLYACWSKLRSQRYMAPREHGSAGRHSACATHVLNNLIYRFSDIGFRACFRMGRASFWRLIHLCENIPEAATISEGGAERACILLDIGYGTIWEYTWRFIRLLVHLARRYISWPSPQQRRQLPAPLMPRQETFSG